MRTVGIDDSSSVAVLRQRRMGAIRIHNHASITVLVYHRVRTIRIYYHRYLRLSYTRTAQ